MWVRAFRGFYSLSAEVGDLDSIAKLLFSARSVILIISVQAAIISGILAYTSNSFNALYFVLVLIGFVVAHATSNLVNDYFGYMRGHDIPGSPRLRYTIHPLASKIMTKNQLVSVITVLVLVGLTIAAFFTAVRGYITLVFLAIGALLLASYDVFPITLKRVGLGEIATFVVWGPLMVGSGFFLITGKLIALPFLASIPYGLGVMSILVGKHIDQMNYDKRIKQNTLPNLLGESASRRLNVLLVISMYASTALLVLLRFVGIPILVIAFNAPAAASCINIFKDRRPQKAPKGYLGWPLWYHRAALRHNRRFGWLYILGLLIYCGVKPTPFTGGI